MWKMGALNFTSFGSQLYDTWKREAFWRAGSESAGWKFNVKRKGKNEREIKKIEEKHECTLEPRYVSVLKKKSSCKPTLKNMGLTMSKRKALT